MLDRFFGGSADGLVLSLVETANSPRSSPGRIIMETISYLLTFLLNSLWQIPRIAAVAALACRLMRNGPAGHRHAVWRPHIRMMGVAIGMDPNYSDAMTYLNLLNRMKASVADSAAESADAVSKANEWIGKALEANRTAPDSSPRGVTGVAASPPPRPLRRATTRNAAQGAFGK